MQCNATLQRPSLTHAAIECPDLDRYYLPLAAQCEIDLGVVFRARATVPFFIAKISPITSYFRCCCTRHEGRDIQP